MPKNKDAQDQAQKTRAEWFEFFEDHTIRCEVSYRGGGIEIDASSLFEDDAKITAYQNYLGGGIAGSIQSDANFTPEDDAQVQLLAEAAENLKRYFYSLNEGGGDEYMHDEVTGPDAGGYEALQKLSKSAY